MTCDCGIYCQDLGPQEGCRYMEDARENMSEYDKWREECPICKSDLRDGKGTKLIHVVHPGKDRVTEYRCPECMAVWPR